MTSVGSNPPGTFCWIELATSDTAAAREFYQRLFGWAAVDHDMGEMGIYTIFQKNGRDAAAMYAKPPAMADVPSNWLSYVATASADQAASQATRLGATVQAEPFDVPGQGRMAVLADPSGATFAVWQADHHHGVGIRDEPDSLCWNELHSVDPEGSKSFYTALFGWRMKESSEYTEWHVGENAIGGMLQTHTPELPPFWLPYFAVTDADATVQRIESLGGTIYVRPTDIPGVGRFAIAADGQGAVFAVIRLIGL